MARKKADEVIQDVAHARYVLEKTNSGRYGGIRGKATQTRYYEIPENNAVIFVEDEGDVTGFVESGAWKLLGQLDVDITLADLTPKEDEEAETPAPEIAPENPFELPVIEG